MQSNLVSAESWPSRARTMSLSAKKWEASPAMIIGWSIQLMALAIFFPVCRFGRSQSLMLKADIPFWGGVAIPKLGRTLIGGQNFPVTETGRSVVHTGAKPIVFGVGGNEFWPKPCRALIEEVLAENGKSSVSLGSCATSLAFAAAGELAGYAEACVGFWDIAAGIALCEAAGLAVTFTSAPGPHSSNIAVGPADFQSEIHAAMLTYGIEEND